jgi:hypothetical protein
MRLMLWLADQSGFAKYRLTTAKEDSYSPIRAEFAVFDNSEVAIDGLIKANSLMPQHGGVLKPSF